MVWPRPYSLSGWIVDSRISSVSWGHGLPWECRSQSDSRDCDRAASKCRILGSRLLHQLLILRNSAKSLPLVCFGNWSTTVRHFRPARSMGEVVGGLYIISFQVFNFKPFQCHVWFAILRASRCRIRIDPLSYDLAFQILPQDISAECTVHKPGFGSLMLEEADSYIQDALSKLRKRQATEDEVKESLKTGRTWPKCWEKHEAARKQLSERLGVKA